MSMITDPQRIRRTDPGRPEICNVFSYHKLFGTPPEEIEAVYRGCTTATLGCVDDKRGLAARVRAAVAPIRERREALLADEDHIEAVLARGAERARAIARPVLDETRAAMGL
jgi:tryptophanyl-tRNA synthetase